MERGGTIPACPLGGAGTVPTAALCENARGVVAACCPAN